MKKLTQTPLATIIGIIILWEGIALAGWFPETLFPGVGTVIKALVKLGAGGAIFSQIAYSIGMVLLSLTLSLSTAGILLWAATRYEWMARQIGYLESIFNPLPGMAILPLVILWVGVTRTGMLLIMMHAMVWPIWAQMRVRLKALKQTYKPFIKAYAITSIRAGYHIYFCGSRSDLLSAVKTAWSRGWRALISIEMIFGMVGSHTGLGWLIYERRMYMDTAGLYGVLLLIALIGVIVEQGLRWLEDRFA
jgi:NitT/TauT family transport system permease protein